MNTSILLYSLGSGALVLLGVIHTIVEALESRRPTPPDIQGTISAMKKTFVQARETTA